MGSAAGVSGFAAGSSLGVDDAVGLAAFFSARSLLCGFRSFFRELRGGVRSLSLPLLLLLLLLLLRDELRPRRLRSLRLCRDFLGGVRSPLSERTRPPLLLALRGGVLSPLFERFRALSLASRGGVFSSSSFFALSSSLGFDLRGEGEDLRASRGGIRSALGERVRSFVAFLTESSSFATDVSFTSSRSLVLLTSALLCFFTASFRSGYCFFAAGPLVTFSLLAFAFALGDLSLLRVGSSFMAGAAVAPFCAACRVARGGVTERDALLSCVTFFNPLSSPPRLDRSDVDVPAALLPRAGDGDLSESDELDEDLDLDRELPLALRRRLSPRRPPAGARPPRDLERDGDLEREDDDDE